jgi:D-aminopeptidase
MRTILALTLMVTTGVCVAAPRARELGVPFDGKPGLLNAITDVAGVTVGQVTLIEDLDGGKKVRTGVTAILPRGRDSLNLHAFAGWFALNGAGELTGTTWVEESGELEGPVLLTNTHSVGVVHDAAIAWRVRQGEADPTGFWWSSAVVGETWDGQLNDINGFHVRALHVNQALEKAAAGPVEEGNVGAGTGTICYEFKCGIGTSSRSVMLDGREQIVGVLVQANNGLRDGLSIAGVPVGRHLRADRVYSQDNESAGETGSIMIVIATDAPLLPHQLKRLAKRAALGLARTGSTADNGSGDIFIAFSTANAAALGGAPAASAEVLPNSKLDGLFRATVQATEEAIVNAMVAARDMRGTNDRYAKALPHAELVALLEHYGRLSR